jgi:hypothetical protein
MLGYVWCPRGSAAILALTLGVVVAPIITSAQADTVTVTGQVAWCRSVPLPVASALDVGEARSAEPPTGVTADDAGLQPPSAPETDVPTPRGGRRAVGLAIPASALVAVQDTAMSTITDEQGRFTLAGVPASSVITITAVSTEAGGEPIAKQVDASGRVGERVDAGTLFLPPSAVGCDIDTRSTANGPDDATETRVIGLAGTTAPIAAPAASAGAEALDDRLPAAASAPVASSGASGAPGITGRVVIGPTCPVQRAGDHACDDRPYPTTVVVLTPEGSREVGRVDTDAMGAFSIALDPGDYLVSALVGGNLLPRGNPVPATVGPAGVTNVTIALDRGIR